MHLLIKEAECGYSAISDDYNKVADVIIKIYNEKDKLKQYGENGFKYASTHFEKNVCINTLEKLF
jgi:glycosyltransferase involved in cell wall biosynthesis